MNNRPPCIAAFGITYVRLTHGQYTKGKDPRSMPVSAKSPPAGQPESTLLVGSIPVRVIPQCGCRGADRVSDASSEHSQHDRWIAA